MKIFITGISGSGKTTLARKLSSALDIPHFNLDDIYWKKRYSEGRCNEECSLALKGILTKNKSWIIEGVFGWCKPAAKKADLVIWLNFGINFCSYRVVKRHFTSKNNSEDMRSLYNLIKYVRDYKKIRPGHILSTFEKQKEIAFINEEKLVEVRSIWQLKKLLRELKL